MSQFEDIAIVDLDLKKTSWSRVHSSMRTLYLKLSREPELEWVRFFQEERESRIVPTRHGFWIEDGYIVFDCLLKNVEPFHLPDFRQSAAFANEHCRDMRAQRREEFIERRAEESAEQAMLDELRVAVRGDAVVVADTTPADMDESAILSANLVTPPIPQKKIDNAPVELPLPEATTTAANDEDDFDTRRNEWRARFREALTSRKEFDRGKQ